MTSINNLFMSFNLKSTQYENRYCKTIPLLRIRHPRGIKDFDHPLVFRTDNRRFISLVPGTSGCPNPRLGPTRSRSSYWDPFCWWESLEVRTWETVFTVTKLISWTILNFISASVEIHPRVQSHPPSVFLNNDIRLLSYRFVMYDSSDSTLAPSRVPTFSGPAVDETGGGEVHTVTTLVGDVPTTGGRTVGESCKVRQNTLVHVYFRYDSFVGLRTRKRGSNWIDWHLNPFSEKKRLQENKTDVLSYGLRARTRFGRF